jgi:hypothetical protein
MFSLDLFAARYKSIFQKKSALLFARAAFVKQFSLFLVAKSVNFALQKAFFD